MFVARWIIDAKFGHKDDVRALCKRWNDEVGKPAGMMKTGGRMLTGSVGAPESRFEMEVLFASLAELEKTWAEMGKNPAHAKFSKELEQHVVSGTNRWEILRVVED
jgi:hypothetical protein